jgi:hypothetical protein
MSAGIVSRIADTKLTLDSECWMRSGRGIESAALCNRGVTGAV